MKPALSPTLAYLVELLPLNKDVRIDDLYAQFWGDGQLAQSEMQQRLGPYITRLNRKLKAVKEQVAPGALRGTYRRSKIAKK